MRRSLNTASGALSSTKLEDIDASAADPSRVVLGDQDSGVFTFDFGLVFSGGFSAGASSFSVTKIANTSGSTNSLDNPDNVDWTATTMLGGTSYPDGLIFVTEDNSTGEIWRIEPDGSNPIRVGSTTVGAENALSCAADCPDVCGDGLCKGAEGTTTCPSDCGSLCGDGVIEGSEACEPGLPLGDTCMSLGFSSGTLACDGTTCQYDTSACMGGTCGGNKAAGSINADCCSNNCMNGSCKGN